ncbi:hypothetical protein AOZ06_16150 [Kibdelosporangium phytohabitans]|uniref:Uncharacterized protein n=1 Tax=Kibdelosporangium phytohabitans TaxID=860235 RepID=A0A0N9HY54_9PSEU|nr:hypothetical protein AOZ06_16150 [Kibdelosporangium phytohabitans]
MPCGVCTSRNTCASFHHGQAPPAQAGFGWGGRHRPWSDTTIRTTLTGWLHAANSVKVPDEPGQAWSMALLTASSAASTASWPTSSGKPTCPGPAGDPGTGHAHLLRCGSELGVNVRPGDVGTGDHLRGERRRTLGPRTQRDG